jgi:histidine triad (HIT) family protein
MSTSDCIFCKIVNGEVPCKKIYEDEAVLAFLDIGPVSDGHTLVVPKAHFEKLHQCPPDVLGKVSSCVGKIAQAVVGAMGATGYNVL